MRAKETVALRDEAGEQPAISKDEKSTDGILIEANGRASLAATEFAFGHREERNDEMGSSVSGYGVSISSAICQSRLSPSAPHRRQLPAGLLE